MLNRLVRMECTGSNCNRLFTKCTSNNIELYDIVRDEKSVKFSISEKNEKLLKKIIPIGLVVNKIQFGFWSNIKKILINRIGILVGFAISIIAYLFISNILINIEIIGSNNIDKAQIEQVLADNNIKKFSQMNYSTKYVEEILDNNFDLSLVSVMKKGNSLIVSVKEALIDNKEDFEPIVAQYNMVIESIDVFSGITNFRSGDIVYAGDIIVEPYEISDNIKKDVRPSAKIVATTFFSESYVFNNVDIVKKRTGKSIVIENNLYLGKYKIIDSCKENIFTSFEIEEYSEKISNYFIPIYINKKIAYELKDVEITRDFESEKELIINNIRDKAISKVPSHLTVENEEMQISLTNFGYIVTIYLKSSVYLNYNISNNS